MRNLLRRLMPWGVLILASGCEPKPDSPLVGSYYRGDGTGYNVTLSLKARSTYSAKWEGCLGTYGTAEGNWSKDGDFLIFEPSREEGMMKGHLRRLRIVVNGASPVFVPEADLSSEYFLRYGADNFIGFHRREDSE